MVTVLNSSETWCSLSFVPKSVNGLGTCDLHGMADDRGDRDAKGDRCSEHERDGRQRDALIEAVQPVAHHPPGNRPGNDVGNDHRTAELPDEQPDDVPGSSAKDLADSNFLGAALGSECREAEEP